MWSVTKKSNNLSTKRHVISKIIIHEDFSRISPQNDYAILLLAKPYKLKSNNKSICIPRNDNADYLLEHNATCVMNGWGKINNSK